VAVDIHVSSNSYPCIHDWNEDGRKDLIIGEIEKVLPDTGNIRVYLNSGTNSAPEFREYQLMEAGGGHLEVVHAHPQIFDLDNDTIKDLVCGNENGFIYFFKNLGTNQVPYFETVYETLMTVDSAFIDGYTNSRIHLCDWTGDGDLDIILGGQDGYVWLCENAFVTGISESRYPYATTVSFRLLHNPVAHTARFQYTVEEKISARLAIYSITGRCIDAFDLKRMHNNVHYIEWHIPDELCEGIYIAVLTARGVIRSVKFVVVR
jgi:hypothetical protein